MHFTHSASFWIVQCPCTPHNCINSIIVEKSKKQLPGTPCWKPSLSAYIWVWVLSYSVALTTVLSATQVCTCFHNRLRFHLSRNSWSTYTAIHVSIWYPIASSPQKNGLEWIQQRTVGYVTCKHHFYLAAEHQPFNKIEKTMTNPVQYLGAMALCWYLWQILDGHWPTRQEVQHQHG